jgi:bifunctional non-homologous end joining protein LigD
MGHLISDDGTDQSLCPRCRDTKGILAKVTKGKIQKEAVRSETSRSFGETVAVRYDVGPQLAKAIKDVRPVGLQQEVWRSPSWIAAEKLDGVRGVLHIMKEGSVLLGRNHVKGSGQYSNLTPNVPHLVECIPDEYDGTILDGEIMWIYGPLNTGSVVTSSALNAATALLNCDPDKSLDLQHRFGRLVYVVFDILYLNGKDLRDLMLSSRMALRDEVVTGIVAKNPFLDPYFQTERSCAGGADEKMAFYDSIVDEGGEGILLKDMTSTYSRTAGSRPNSWVKVKKRYSVDAFVTGFIPGEAGIKGMVGAMEVSVYKDGKPTAIAAVSGIEMALRKEISARDGSLKPEYYGRVVQVSFQELTGKSGRGRHAVFEGFRPDKDAAECDGVDMGLVPV